MIVTDKEIAHGYFLYPVYRHEHQGYAIYLDTIRVFRALISSV